MKSDTLSRRQAEQDAINKAVREILFAGTLSLVAAVFVLIYLFWK